MNLSPHPFLLRHRFTRAELASAKPASLPDLIGPSQLHDPAFLTRLHDRLHFVFPGYEALPWVHTEPPLRRFCRALRRQWPWWLWFGTVRTGVLGDMLYACLPRLVTRQRTGETHLDVTFRHQDLTRVLLPQCQALQTLGRRAGWSEHRIAARIQEVGDYLGLPSVPADSKSRET